MKSDVQVACWRNAYFTWAAIVAMLLVFAGFARTYYLKTFFATPALPTLLHLHGAILTLWFVLFFVQVRLVAAHRVDLHRLLGTFGAVLAAFRFYGLARQWRSKLPRRDYLADPAFGCGSEFPCVLATWGTASFACFVSLGLLLRRRPEISQAVDASWVVLLIRALPSFGFRCISFRLWSVDYPRNR